MRIQLLRVVLPIVLLPMVFGISIIGNATYSQLTTTPVIVNGLTSAIDGITIYNETILLTDLSRIMLIKSVNNTLTSSIALEWKSELSSMRLINLPIILPNSKLTVRRILTVTTIDQLLLVDLFNLSLSNFNLSLRVIHTIDLPIIQFSGITSDNCIYGVSVSTSLPVRQTTRQTHEGNQEEDGIHLIPLPHFTLINNQLSVINPAPPKLLKNIRGVVGITKNSNDTLVFVNQVTNAGNIIHQFTANMSNSVILFNWTSPFPLSSMRYLKQANNILIGSVSQYSFIFNPTIRQFIASLYSPGMQVQSTDVVNGDAWFVGPCLYSSDDTTRMVGDKGCISNVRLGILSTQSLPLISSSPPLVSHLFLISFLLSFLL
jgi:hypothetical protein